MIVRFFKSGTSNGESPVHYLLRMRDHEGNLRPEVPELLAGTPQLTIDLINGISRKHKYCSGCLAFRPGEQPTRADLFRILDRFKEVVAPGLSPDQFNGLFVLHNEPPDRKTGQCGFHVHFVFPMTLLAGKTATGKSLAGTRWNPHPPGRRTIETMDLFTRVTNHEHNWRQVTENPLRVGMDSFWHKAPNVSQRQRGELLRKEVSRSIAAGELNSRTELVRFLDEGLGLTVTRVTDRTVSLRFPGAAKAVRLKGAMFEARTDYASLREATTLKTGNTPMPLSDYQQALERLDQLLALRAKELQGHRSNGGRKDTTTTTTTRKGSVYGRNQERLGGGDTSRQGAGRLRPVPQPTSGLERGLFQASSGQRRHEDGRGHQTSHDGPQATAYPSQHLEWKGESAHGRQRQRRSGGVTTSSPAGDIDQKIWALAVELNDYEVGSPEAGAILNQLAVLQGERERQPRGPRPWR